VGGFFLAYRVRFWQATTAARFQREDDLALAERTRLDEVLAAQARIERHARGLTEDDAEESSPLGPVPPTPDQVEVERRWKKTLNRRG
jgi:hypothetical protein